MKGMEGPPGSAPLVRKIRSRMAASPQQALRFRDYMELCLYDPESGYYMKEQTKIGREGDFYTGSQIGSVLGDILARYILKLASAQTGLFSVTEWGAGTGRLGSQILDFIKAESPELYGRLVYRIIEKSPYHRKLQLETLEAHSERLSFGFPDEAGVRNGDGTSGLVFSNELLDAFPVFRVRQRPEGLMELYVRWNDEEGRFEETELPCTDPELARYLEEGGIRLSVGQTAEINLEAARWIRERGRSIGQETLLTIDYGDTAEELYGSHRMNGTLMCYKNHQAYDQPYIYAGEQDMTSHVDFSACIRAGADLELEGTLVTQKQFLVENGVLGMLQDHAGGDPFSQAARRNRAIRQLLLSDGMSELFKVLIQQKAPEYQKTQK